jgi:short-subunit dehydrogenase
MPYALITGASAGIGKEFANQLAQAGYDLVLVARDINRLEAVGENLKHSYGVEYEVISADLSKELEIEKVAKRLNDQDRFIEVLVNNAGFGLNTSFGKTAKAEEDALLDVLVRAPIHLTRAVIPLMVERNKGYVINVGSVAAWITTGTYSAAKAWLHSFSESLYGQYSKQGVYVSVVAPGFTKTEFHQRANISTASLPKWMWLSDEFVVRKSLKGAFNKKAVVVPGWQYKTLRVVAKYLPNSAIRAFSNYYRSKRK